jgi:hypothetical protein
MSTVTIAISALTFCAMGGVMHFANYIVLRLLIACILGADGYPARQVIIETAGSSAPDITSAVAH